MRRMIVAVAACVSLVGVAGCERALRLGPTEPGQEKRFQMAQIEPTPTSDVPAIDTDFTVDLWVRYHEHAASDQPCASSNNALIRSGDFASIDGLGVVGAYNQWAMGVGPDGDPWFGVDLAFHSVFDGSPESDLDYFEDPVCATLPDDGLFDGSWHHVAAQRGLDGSITLFVDGGLVAEGTAAAGSLEGNHPGPPLQGPMPYLSISGQSSLLIPAESTTADVDEVRISKGRRWLDSFVPSRVAYAVDDDTLALWHFDDMTDRTSGPGTWTAATPDASGNGYDLRLETSGSWGETGDGFANESPFTP